jgi:branched-chain amino acid transport system substrate-binding protein
MHSFARLAAFAIFCGSLPALAAEPIRIGVDGPFTGGSAPAGLSMRNAAHMAAEEINRAGGVLGRPLLLIDRDDEAKNELGVQVAQELIYKENVVAAIGFINTGVALAAQRFYQEAQIPVIDNVAAGSILTHQFDDQPANYIFRNSAIDRLQAPLIVDEALTHQGLRHPAILADSTNYGQFGREDLEKVLALRGVKPVTEEKFNIGDTDMTSQLLRARAAGADVLLVYGIGAELAQIAVGRVKLGWNVPIVGCWSLAFSSYIDITGAAGQGTRMPVSFIQEPTNAKRRAFIEDYLRLYHPKFDRIETPSQGAQGYDSVYLLAAAIRQAGSTDGPKIRAALEDLHEPVEGVVKTYVRPFTKADHDAFTAENLVIGEVRGQQVVFAYEADRRRASGKP